MLPILRELYQIVPKLKRLGSSLLFRFQSLFTLFVKYILSFIIFITDHSK